MVVLVQPGDWTFGVLVNNVWSFAGNEDRANVHLRHLLGAAAHRTPNPDP